LPGDASQIGSSSFLCIYIIFFVGLALRRSQTSFGVEDDGSGGSMDRSGGFCSYSKLVHLQRKLTSQHRKPLFNIRLGESRFWRGNPDLYSQDKTRNKEKLKIRGKVYTAIVGNEWSVT